MVRLTTMEGDASFSTTPRIGTNAPRLGGWFTDLQRAVAAAASSTSDYVGEKASDAWSYTSKVFSEANTEAAKKLADQAVAEARAAQTSISPLTPYVEKGKQEIPAWILVASAGAVVLFLTTRPKGGRK